MRVITCQLPNLAHCWDVDASEAPTLPRYEQKDITKLCTMVAHDFRMLRIGATY